MPYNEKQKEKRHDMREEYKGKLPIITILCVASNLIIWIVLECFGSTLDSEFMLEHGAAYLPAIIEGKEWWRLFSCMFLHFGEEHLVNNMLLLGVTGSRLENTLGSFRFLLLYIVSGLCGSTLSIYVELQGTQMAVSAGASGAVFGIVGGLIAWAIWNKGIVEGVTLAGLLGMAALNLYLGFTTEGVDNWGHIGGLLGGFLLGCIFAIASKIRSRD